MSEPTVAIAPLEQFASLASTRTLHGFIGRVPGIAVQTDRAEALTRLADSHRAARQQLTGGSRLFATAEQVHGDGVAVLAEGNDVPRSGFPMVDGLITNRPDVCLGIYVADCCAVYLVDPVRRAIGLIHAGKKGTELRIVPKAMQAMRRNFGSTLADLIVQLSPCIRPPWYEVDFAVGLITQCQAEGVVHVVDGGTCTAANPGRYYSYRREKGRTGRMLALLALA